MTNHYLKTPAVVSRRVAGALLAVLLAGAMASVPHAAVAAPTPAPTVPAATLSPVDVAGTTMMSAAALDLGAAGYTEREFYADGLANRYDGTDSLSLTTATLIDGNWPYRSRVVVRTPEAAHFNGSLVVEWTNVTLGQDAEFSFAESHDYLLREGYAVAVVSAQRVGVEQLKTWSPARYGSLSVDVNVCGTDGTSLCTGDPLSYDIIAQVSQALKDNAGAEQPMPGLTVENVIATGQSQSAIRLTSYYNTIQPLHNVFDGIVYWDRSDQLRSDLDTPAVSVNSEALSMTYPPVTTGAYTRAWDVAGTTHGSFYAAQYIDAVVNRDRSLIGPDGPWSFTDWVAPSCEVSPIFSTVPVGFVVGAAFDAVRTWILTGEAAPASTVFERAADGSVVRDANGKAMGGVQLSQLVAPTEELSAFNGTAFPCGVSGSHRPFSEEELKARYQTHGTYLAAVRDTMEQAVAGGYVLRHDADAAIEAAAQSNVARTDVTLEAAVEPTDQVIGGSIRETITPTLVSGVWLQIDGATVPVTLTGTSYFSATEPVRSDSPPEDATLLATRSTVLGGPAAITTEPVATPYRAGYVSTQWCIDDEAQPEEYRGHINEWCSDYGVPSDTVRLVGPDFTLEAQQGVVAGAAIRTTALVAGPVPAAGIELSFEGFLQPANSERASCTPENRIFASARPLTVTDAGTYRSEEFVTTDRHVGTVIWVETARIAGNGEIIHAGECGAVHTLVTAPAVAEEIEAPVSSAPTGLAQTGAQTATPLAAAAGLLVLGALALLVMRLRRRVAADAL